MGFWDKVKSVAVSAKCMTGWHAGDYEHIKGKPLCHMGKTCPDCKKYVTTMKHEYNDWKYLTYDKCDSVKECIHCGHKESEVRHTFEENGKDSNCKVIKICSRCNLKEVGGARHEWITIPFTNHEIKAKGKRKCKDCGYVE